MRGIKTISGIYATNVFRSDYGEVRLPKDIPAIRWNKDGWPDRRYSVGQDVRLYLRYLIGWAHQQYVSGKNPDVAPSYRKWLNSAPYISNITPIDTPLMRSLARG
jgi:hypothetical protein